MNKPVKNDGTVGKALEILDAVAMYERPVRFSELLEQSPYPKATLYRFLQTLTNQKFLEYDQTAGTYSLGIRLMRLAHTAWKTASLAPIARPHTEELVAKVAADIKSLKPVEPYKAKGIKEKNQYVLRKEGKKK